MGVCVCLQVSFLHCDYLQGCVPNSSGFRSFLLFLSCVCVCVHMYVCLHLSVWELESHITDKWKGKKNHSWQNDSSAPALFLCFLLQPVTSIFCFFFFFDPLNRNIISVERIHCFSAQQRQDCGATMT